MPENPIGNKELKEYLDAAHRVLKRGGKDMAKLGLIYGEVLKHKANLLKSRKNTEGVSKETLQKIDEIVVMLEKLLSTDEE